MTADQRTEKQQFWGKVSRFYYADTDNFEQSFDVYSPADRHSTKERTVVVLVVGSGWMGHQPWIYYLTSWWNSGGPKNIARLGYPCVCIRHRGAYFSLPAMSFNHIFYGILAYGMLSAMIGSPVASLAAFMIISLLGFLKMTSSGRASFDDMLNDVARALQYIEANKDNILPSDSAMEKRIIFGGYSSGGHVAATLLQKPQILRAHQLPADPASLFAGILLLSGVLAVEPIEKVCVGTTKPRFLTDFVMTTVWGKHTHTVPSPVVGRIPKLPHLLIGNRNEVFGLNWLDIFFCSSEYAAAASAAGIDAKYHEVRSDHWNILASRVLQDVLREELPRLGNIS